MSQQASYPNAAYILSMIAGVFILLGGLLLALVGAAFTFFVFGIGAIIGLFGIVFGIIIIISAQNLRAHPSQHITWGAIILVFSILSWAGAFGGFFLGFLLGLIGGVLALTWTPPQPQQSQNYTGPAPTPTYSTSTTPTSPTRYCPNCGAPVGSDTNFCPHCGKQLPPS